MAKNIIKIILAQLVPWVTYETEIYGFYTASDTLLAPCYWVIIKTNFES